jgi:hypothetical protein
LVSRLSPPFRRRAEADLFMLKLCMTTESVASEWHCD